MLEQIIWPYKFASMLNIDNHYLWICACVIIICLVFIISLVLLIIIRKYFNKIAYQQKRTLDKLKLRVSEMETAYISLRKEIDLMGEKENRANSTIKVENPPKSKKVSIDADQRFLYDLQNNKKSFIPNTGK